MTKRTKRTPATKFPPSPVERTDPNVTQFLEQIRAALTSKDPGMAVSVELQVDYAMPGTGTGGQRCKMTITHQRNWATQKPKNIY